MSQVEQAFDELRNALWMLVIPLALSAYSLFAAFQWQVQDSQWNNRLAEIQGSAPATIEEVSTSECLGTRPAVGAICARSSDWWQPADPSLCAGGELCYQRAKVVEVLDLLAQAERSYFPLVAPGLIPLLFVVLVMRKIARARSALRSARGYD